VLFAGCCRFTMYQDYEDYGDFLDNPPRLITCPRGNATAPRDDEDDPSQIDCVDPFLLDGRRRRFSEPCPGPRRLFKPVLPCLGHSERPPYGSVLSELTRPFPALRTSSWPRGRWRVLTQSVFPCPHHLRTSSMLSEVPSDRCRRYSEPVFSGVGPPGRSYVSGCFPPGRRLSKPVLSCLGPPSTDVPVSSCCPQLASRNPSLVADVLVSRAAVKTPLGTRPFSSSSANMWVLGLGARPSLSLRECVRVGRPASDGRHLRHRVPAVPRWTAQDPPVQH